jgi:hypothetical protein
LAHRVASPLAGARALAWLATALLALAPAALAQVSVFQWTLEGSPLGDGFVVGETLHVEGPDGGLCVNETTWLETVAPSEGTVSVSAVFDNQDSGCHYDAPAWVHNGVVTKVPESSNCWGDGVYAIEFDVQQGDTLGLGVWAADCAEGPGIADFIDFDFDTGGWTNMGLALDPRLGSTLAGVLPGSGFGQSVAGLDDVDGDGVADIAVGAPFEGDSGVMRVLSGADGSLLWLRQPGSAGAQFGWAVAAAGDVDGDGTGDVVVGAPFHKVGGLSSAGKVIVYSGPTGDLIFQVNGTVWAGFLGKSVAGVGDIDGNGFDDVLVGEPVNSGTEYARAFVHGGPEGALLSSTTAPDLNSHMGTSVAGIDDVTGDGVRDLVLGAPRSNSYQVLNPFITSEVHIASGADGSIVRTLTGTGGFGWSVAVVPDVDGDGRDDLAVGAPSGTNVSLERVGRVALHSSVTGVEHERVLGSVVDGFFGASLAGGVDLDGDGGPDLAVGTPMVALDDVVGNARLLTLPGLVGTATLRAQAEELGTSLALLADSDGDGLDELMVGSPTGGAGSTGLVRIYDELDRIRPPRLDGLGELSGGSPLSLSIAKAPPSSPAWLVVGFASASLPFKGGVLVPHPHLLVPLVTGKVGTLSIDTVWPTVQPPFFTLWFQLWMQHADGPVGWIASNALRASGTL